MSKLRFHVVSFTSEEDGYSADELNVHGPNTKGWQSAKFSIYPQEIFLELDDGEARLSQIQILSHQSKISSKIEIFIGQGNNYQTANYKRLGYMTLDSNERSEYKARELKTVYIDHVGSYLRFLIHKNYVNDFNYFNQVGIIAINLMGSVLSKTKNGQKVYAPVTNNPLNDLSIDMNLDPQTTTKLRQLSDAKAKAVASEDYVTAKSIKNIENDLKELGCRLAQLEISKRNAVEAEDYDEAKNIKDEMDDLRNEIDRKISTVNIPGITDFRPLPVKHEDYRQPLSARRTELKPSRHGDIDDLPVGRNSSSENKDYSYNSPKSIPKVVNDTDDFTENYSDDKDYSRPIKPKATMQYNDEDQVSRNDEYVNVNSNNNNNKEERFPPGQHPLAGIENYADLPTPELLTGKAKEVSDSNGITTFLGEYRARCLFSKTWSLRDAILNYVNNQLKLKKYDNSPGISEVFPALAAIVKVGVEDKMQAVFLNGILLLEEVLLASKRAQLSKTTAGPLIEPVIPLLIEKLADTNVRISNGAKKGIDLLVNSPNIGTNTIATHTLKPLLSKYQSNWKFVLSRIKLLIDVISIVGIGNNTGYTADNVLTFVKNLNGFAHGTGEVRDASKDLTVIIQKFVGTEAVEPYLSSLRKVQLEEYYAAFGSELPIVKVNPASNIPPVTTPKNKSNQNTNTKQSTNATKQTKDNSNDVNTNKGTNPTKNNNKNDSNKAEPVQEEVSDFTVCMFCGESDKSWNEDALDLHYWKSCALLSPCPACAQVVEIAGLPEHLLDECEHKTEYEACETTGLAIRKNEMNSWKNSSKCKPPPENCIYCPLCLSSVEDSDEAWKQHLIQGCPLNTRIQH